MRTVGWQWVALVGIACGLVAVVLVSLTVIVLSLNSTQVTELGHWIDSHGAGIWTALTGAAAAVGSFFFGRSRGKRAGARTAAEVARGRATGPDAAEAILTMDP